MKVLKENSLLLFAMVFSNISVLGLNFMIPKYLSAESYVGFSFTWSLSQFLVVLCFEWLRVTLIRYTETKDNNLSENIVNSIFSFYYLISLLILIFSMIMYFFQNSNDGIFYIIVAIYVVCQGCFDAKQAVRRAKFHTVSYSKIWILRSLMAFLLAIFVANYFSNEKLVLFSLSISFLIGCFSLPKKIKISFSGSGLFVRYGFFIALSSIISSVFIVLVKYCISDNYSYNQSAGGILSFDLSFKILTAIGMAVNIVFLQKSIRSIERDSSEIFKVKNKRNISMILSAIIPSGFGYYLIQPFVINNFVPYEYLSFYEEGLLIFVIGSVLVTVRVYAVDTQFIITGKYKNSLYGSLFTVLLFFVFSNFFSDFNLFPGKEFSYSFLISSFFGFVLSFVFVLVEGKVLWPVKDFFKILSSSLVMFFVGSFFDFGKGIWFSLFGVFVCILTYLVLMIVFNYMGIFSEIIKKIKNICQS